MKPAENEAFKDLSITYHWSSGYGYMVDYKEVAHYWHYIGPLSNQHAYQAGTTYTSMKGLYIVYVTCGNVLCTRFFGNEPYIGYT